jgi:hypothetical protein
MAMMAMAATTAMMAMTATMMPNGDDNYENQVATTARVMMMVARALVTGAKRATTGTTATMATMAMIATMTPNSNDAASGNKGNMDTKQ